MGREQYCPNMFYDTNQVSIGEFNTLQECMDFPIRDIWCINREEDNLFEKYKSQGNRVLIICCWERSDKWRFVVAIVKDGNTKYFDFNDLPMDLVQSDFETYIGKDAVATIKGLNECTIYNKETNENKIMNKKQVIRLTESQFRQIVKESVEKVLNEFDVNPEMGDDRTLIHQAKRGRKSKGDATTIFGRDKVDRMNYDIQGKPIRMYAIVQWVVDNSKKLWRVMQINDDSVDLQGFYNGRYTDDYEESVPSSEIMVVG